MTTRRLIATGFSLSAIITLAVGLLAEHPKRQPGKRPGLPMAIRAHADTLAAAQASLPTAAERAAAPEPAGLDERQVAEILQMRRNRGTLLEGTLLEDALHPAQSAEGDPFADALRRAAESPRHVAAATPGNHHQDGGDDLGNHDSKSADPAPQVTQTACTSPSSPALACADAARTGTSDRHLATALRRLATRVDRRADESEEELGYELADELRGLADHLRAASRQLRASGRQVE